MTKHRLIFLLATAVLIAACSKPSIESSNSVVIDNSAPAKPGVASTTVVKVTSSATSVSKNDSADAVVRMQIDSGYHVNANPPTFPYLKATEVEVPQSQGLSVGFIRYPNPVTKKFAFAEQPLAVYEGETLITIRLKADKSAKSGLQNLVAHLRVQACDNQVCYAPGVIDFTIPVNIK